MVLTIPMPITVECHDGRMRVIPALSALKVLRGKTYDDGVFCAPNDFYHDFGTINQVYRQ
jgi:hypothetical protein